MRVSAETIYQSLYVQSRGALRRELTKGLRTGRTLRRPCRQAVQRRNRIPDEDDVEIHALALALLNLSLNCPPAQRGRQGNARPATANVELAPPRVSHI